jgi:outer membrane protein assembly factor BamB
VVGSTVIVATEEDYVYGLNAATGAVKWTTRLGTPYTMTSCTALHPHIGVTGTPVYDPA